MTAKVINISDAKKIESIIKEKFGDQFIFGYIDGEDCHTYMSPDIRDINLTYLLDTLRLRKDHHFPLEEVE